MTTETTTLLAGEALAALKKTDLVEYAKNELGEELNPNDTKEQLLAQITDLQAELLQDTPLINDEIIQPPTGGVIGDDKNGAVIDNAGADESALTQIARKTPGPEDRVWLRIANSGDETQPVFCGVNGDEVLIPREKWVHTKRKHVFALQAAQITVYHDGVASSIARYALTIDQSLTRPAEPTQSAHGLIEIGD